MSYEAAITGLNLVKKTLQLEQMQDIIKILILTTEFLLDSYNLLLAEQKDRSRTKLAIHMSIVRRILTDQLANE